MLCHPSRVPGRCCVLKTGRFRHFLCASFGGVYIHFLLSLFLFFAQKSPIPRWRFAALDDMFLGLPLLSTVVALLVSFLPFLYKV